MEKENLILEVKPEISTKEIENELIEKKVISEEQVENSLNYEKLSDAEKSAIDEFISKILIGKKDENNNRPIKIFWNFTI